MEVYAYFLAFLLIGFLFGSVFSFFVFYAYSKLVTYLFLSTC